MYRIRLYIVPEQDETVLSNNGEDWWTEQKCNNSRVSITHRARRGSIIRLTGDQTLKNDNRRNVRNNWDNAKKEVETHNDQKYPQ